MDDLEQLAVRHIMVAEPIRVAPDQPLQAVIRLMADHKIGAVLVCDGDVIRGIFTERDLLRHAASAPVGWRQQPVSDWMTRQPHTIGPDAGWEEAMALMERLHVRHLPVIEDGRTIGIVSSRQLIGRRTVHLNQLVERRTRELNETTALLMERELQSQHNLTVAGRLLSRALLPHEPPRVPEMAGAVRYLPLDPLGGDYFDYTQPDDRYLGMLIADASGHSLPAAMVAIMARIAFDEAVRAHAPPGDVLADMNRRLLGLTDERFVTAFYGVYDRATRVLTYANAGHPYPLRYDAAARAVEPLSARGLMLGVMDDAAYAERSLTLAPGDRLCLYTDGISEAVNAAGELFGTDGLSVALQRHGELPAALLLAELERQVAEFRAGKPANDDQTLIVLEIKHGGSG